jgi:hypothetical protein
LASEYTDDLLYLAKQASGTFSNIYISCQWHFINTNARHISLITLVKYAQSHKIGKPNNFNIFRYNKNKGHKQDVQNRLGSPMLETGEP